MLLRAGGHHAGSSASLLADHGLTINDYEALLVLSSAPDQRLKRVDLARRLLSPSGVTACSRVSRRRLS